MEYASNQGHSLTQITLDNRHDYLVYSVSRHVEQYAAGRPQMEGRGVWAGVRAIDSGRTAGREDGKYRNLRSWFQYGQALTGEARRKEKMIQTGV